MTIDSLVDQEYVRSYEDHDGVTHLHKWHEFDDIVETLEERIREREEEIENEKDDTP